MGRNIEEHMGIKKEDYRRNNKMTGNRRTQKIEKEVKDPRITVAQIANEIHRRKMRRKATRKEKKNTKTVKNKSSESTQILREFSKCQRKMARESANVESKIDQNTEQIRRNTEQSNV